MTQLCLQRFIGATAVDTRKRSKEETMRYSKTLDLRGRSALAAHHQDLTDRARDRHDELTTAIEQLERALADAGIYREQPWAQQAGKALETVRQKIRAHSAGVEEAEGLFDEIEAYKPALDRRVSALRKEHRTLSSRAGDLASALSTRDTVDVVQIREQAAELLQALRAHRAAEADLVFEAFWTEFGEGD